MQWNGHISFDRVQPAQFIRAMPELVRRIYALEFDAAGHAILDGRPHSGLRLISGSNGVPGAVYAAVRRPEAALRNDSQDVFYISLEANDRAELTVLIVAPRGSRSVHRRLRLANPTAPTELEWTQSQDIKPNELGGEMAQILHVDITRMHSEIGPAPANLDFMANSKKLQLELWPDGPNSARFIGQIGDAGLLSRLFGQRLSWLYTKAAESYFRVNLRGLNLALADADDRPVADIAWSALIDQLADQPTAESLAAIEQSTAA